MYKPKKFWNQRALNRPNREWDGQVMRVAEWVKPLLKVDSKVLDVGSGGGRLWKTFKQWNIPALIYPCDISTEMAKIHFKNTGIRPTIWDGKTIPFKDEMFDLTVCHLFFLHVRPELIERVWNECVRVTKKYWFLTINIGTGEKRQPHCFVHDYLSLLWKTKIEMKVLRWEKGWTTEFLLLEKRT